jgi:2-dehydro-3-deoxyphosphogluconate aldolase/(4S)-4-hydroxy-2-oxoglutarate aldolase
VLAASRELVARLGQFRIVPVVVIEKPDDATLLADALVAGGVGCMEITLRTAAAADAISALAGRTDIVVGAGTVTSAAQVDLALDAGATFAVSPGFDDGVAARCAERGVPLLPGVATATEIMRALAAGFDVVKLFPVEAIGGLATLKALAAPFPALRFVPTGGIDAARAAAYLAHPAVLAVGGSWMAPGAAMARGAWDEIEQAARSAARLVSETTTRSLPGSAGV